MAKTNQSKKAKYDIVHLNNKSRKGTYLYVKAKGKPSRYYKYTGDTAELEALVNYYDDRFIKNKTKGSSIQYKKAYKERITKSKIPTKLQTPIHKQAQRYVAKIRKQGSLNKLVGKGITETKINNILNAGQTKLRKAKTELLKELVLDQTILDALIKEENMKKMKYRMEHRIKVQDKYGNTILEAKKFNITLDKIQKEIKKTLTVGETVQEGERYGGAVMKLKNAGYQVSEGGHSGQINNISVHTIFRKAK